MKLESIRITNLRSLRDTGEVPIKPLTLLLGGNGSGKSTFLRVFPLLRQSAEARTNNSLLLYSDEGYVDFGGFDDALRKAEDADTIGFEFGYSIDDDRLKVGFGLSGLGNGGVFTKDVYAKINTAGTNSFYIFLTKDESGVVLDYDVNGFPYEIKREKTAGELKFLARVSFLCADAPLYGSNVSRVLGKELTLGALFPGENDLKQLNKLFKRVDSLALDNGKVTFLKAASCELYLSGWITQADGAISLMAKATRYIGPVRATAERFYRRQNLKVDEVDYQGRNLVAFLDSLERDELKEFQRWLQETIGLQIEVQDNGLHVVLLLKLKDGGRYYNLADMGFGFSQILPVLVQLWSIVRVRKRREDSDGPLIFAMEQPELHLHPSMQAKVADMLMAAVKLAQENGVDLRLVVETHSEAIINRIGGKIYKKKFNHDDVSVVMFEKEDPDSDTEVHLSSYNEEGSLENWPYGFFLPEGA